jgi:hypothetical protein
MKSYNAYYLISGLLIVATNSWGFAASYYTAQLWRRVKPYHVVLVISLVGLLLIYLFRRPIQPRFTTGDLTASIALQLVSYNSIWILYSRSSRRRSSKTVAPAVLLVSLSYAINLLFILALQYRWFAL